MGRGPTSAPKWDDPAPARSKPAQSGHTGPARPGPANEGHAPPSRVDPLKCLRRLLGTRVRPQHVVDGGKKARSLIELGSGDLEDTVRVPHLNGNVLDSGLPSVDPFGGDRASARGLAVTLLAGTTTAGFGMALPGYLNGQHGPPETAGGRSR
jgi:hypothetical protein